jgi:hypothetical protein
MKSNYDLYKKLANTISKDLGNSIVDNIIKLKIQEKMIVLDPAQSNKDDSSISFMNMDSNGNLI